MLIAISNVKNMFERAKAMKEATWVERKPALEPREALMACLKRLFAASSTRPRMLAKSMGLKWRIACMPCRKSPRITAVWTASTQA